MATTTKQKTAIALILIIGLIATAALLFGGRAGSEHADEHEDPAKEALHGSAAHGDSHAKHEAHADDEPRRAHAEDKAHDTDKKYGTGGVATDGTSPGGHTEPGAAKSTTDAHANEPDSVALTPEQSRSAGVTVETAAPATLQPSRPFPGEIRFDDDRTAHVVPRVDGVVASVHANLGQVVKAGQLLAVIASTSVSENRSELLAAQQRLALATSLHDREKKLWEEKISAEQDYLQARAGWMEAQIAVRNARQKLAAIGASSSGGATAGLNRFELRAPFAGTLVEKHLALGEAVRADANVFLLSDLTSVWAEFNVPASDIASVRVGADAVVSSTAFTGSARGKVAYVGSLLGEQTRTAKARVTLANPDAAWRPGLFVTVSLAAPASQAATAVPVDAVQTVEGKP
ncbi:MAG: efflux transporter periplasmic adaptor subunit, partial [Rhizobacter sp.]|nr:efflux transporter periplasmic adaptor subunit [Rhizobacter sp.]